MHRALASHAAADEVVGRLAHDVRTPLLTARSAVSLVREQLGELAPDLEALVGRAEAALDRVDRTLTAAVEHARVGTTPLAPRRVEVRGVLLEAIASVGADAEARTVVSGQDRSALADPDALRRIVTNLVDNALRYGGDGTVQVTIGGGGAVVTIEVHDDGPGLGGDDDLFAPFVRGATSNGRDGSGLGLATAADLARRLGGHLSGRDVPEGGAVLTLELPAAT
ncbi:MAG: HAMP domain-containing sensor histidine kinase [Nitriliruptor sp.]|uniref:sensor histidine kinase n=1 Tax=Nitriliruptor sp. TaxID=2448056 RepID=UPI0034A09447